jgi:hypothetical protein
MSHFSTFFTRILRATGLRKKPAAMPKRSDPCPCGSGKIFKDCHLPQVLKEAREAKAKKPPVTS